MRRGPSDTEKTVRLWSAGRLQALALLHIQQAAFA